MDGPPPLAGPARAVEARALWAGGAASAAVLALLVATGLAHVLSRDPTWRT